MYLLAWLLPGFFLHAILDGEVAMAVGSGQSAKLPKFLSMATRRGDIAWRQFSIEHGTGGVTVAGVIIILRSHRLPQTQYLFPLITTDCHDIHFLSAIPDYVMFKLGFSIHL